MKCVALIPARYQATRFPGKLIQQLQGKSIIRHAYENTRDSQLFDEVIVVTDSDIIFKEITHYGGYAIMSKNEHESGSDRIAEVLPDIDTEIVVNVQGDEPFVKRDFLEKLIAVFKDKEVKVASLMHPLLNKEDINNPNAVKVVVDISGFALYFSRSPVPFSRNAGMAASCMKHIGIYAYRKETLLDFASWEKTPLERMEMLEQLRYLENGIPMKMVQVNGAPVAIDTPEDLEKARALFERTGKIIDS